MRQGRDSGLGTRDSQQHPFPNLTGRHQWTGLIRSTRDLRQTLPGSRVPSPESRLHRTHQKYPSSFFFSIDAPGSWSITRPCRSELVVTSISAMIFSSESASDSMAPVSG